MDCDKASNESQDGSVVPTAGTTNTALTLFNKNESRLTVVDDKGIDDSSTTGGNRK
jgi:hypothetical protein